MNRVRQTHIRTTRISRNAEAKSRALGSGRTVPA